MKTRRNALLLGFCAVLLVVASVFGTVAYMTSKDQVKNTFTVGKVAINLDEAKVTGRRQAGRRRGPRSGEQLQAAPGLTAPGTPMVTVLTAARHPCRMKVTFNNLPEPSSICAPTLSSQKMAPTGVEEAILTIRMVNFCGSKTP